MTGFETITPAIALAWLTRDARVSGAPWEVSPALMGHYVADMKAGRWDLRNERPITIERNGRIRDGRRRLNACVASDSQFTTYVRRRA